ncbi:gliding motility-associated C-terminal domain-containing protein [Croceivirga thetidis]|uniref:T9SS type B sorting domain-containing protein n=1 Tax=Croceivirga thetidis TaxID=2721623 RepID=A0ABX1GU34_9FLAO|nr:gliding motility-associated C-terminal domain-containing protein [Croceivirga thetidis]NKI33436.1 T9SS type B sorting domain-containing protein [Croceivirga thetidis]
MLLWSISTSAQFLLQAPESSDEHNYRWFEASDTATVLSTDSFYQVTQPGVYFATYDGTLCGSNATGYFIVTNCNAPFNEVTLDISASVPNGATVSWSPSISGDQLRPTVTSDSNVERYVATITKVGNSTALPRFTVVCMDQAATLVDDFVSVDEDSSVEVPIFDNDFDLPSVGTLSTSDPSNGTIAINDNGTPNDPSDDIVTYTPNPDFNGTDSFTYTICNDFGDCSTATVVVDVDPIVDTNDDSVATEENTDITISWRVNDNDIPSTGTITTTFPANGTVILNDNNTPDDPSDDDITYVPNTGFIGTDTFEYTVCDDEGNCETATITVVVTPPAVSDIDTDDDGIVDSFEDLNLDLDGDPSTNPTDTDGDGIPDYMDIDSDNDGIPDNIEAQSTEGYIPPSGVDANNNGLDDAYEQDGNLGIIPIVTDDDGIPDYVDEDSDNDGVPDRIEGHDFDMDGIADYTLIGSDKDNDGLDDGFEGESTIDRDVNDEIEDPSYLPDSDGDGIPDFRDTDDDGDGLLTMDEDINNDANFANDDWDEDGTPDYLDIDVENPEVVEIEVFNVITPNDDGVHDVLKIDNLDNYPNNTVRIYNRWGVMVFQTKAYNTEGNVFDGKSQGRVTIEEDNKLPVGTYFYIIDYEDDRGEMKQLTGYIYLNL